MTIQERSEFLQQLLENTNTWLHFAEAKNAALIAFNVAIIAAFINSNLSVICKPLFTGIIIGLLISTIIALCSFKPINKYLIKSDNADINLNLLHYAYVASLEKNEFLKKIYTVYWQETFINTSIIPQIEIDYAEEIIQNSRITLEKQTYFKKAFYIDIAMLSGLAILVIFA